MVGVRGRQLIDAGGYAFTIVLLVCLGSFLVMGLTGTGFFVAEFVMFLAGWAIIAYSLFLLNPDPPWTVERTDNGRLQVTKTDTKSPSMRSETTLQRFVQRIPPVSWYQLPHEDRVPPGVKLLLSGALTLLLSFIFERTVIV